MLAEFGDDQMAVVKQSMANDYQGLFALKNKASSNNKPNWAKIPANNDEMWPWSKEHKYPGPGQQDYFQYRRTLQAAVEKRLASEANNA